MNSNFSADTGKQALIILGMHRSGTSATTGALKCLGVQLGEKLYKGHEGINPKGYFEHGGIADTNDEVLYAIGSSWDDILPLREDWWKQDVLRKYALKIKRYITDDFQGSILWSVKDPRICRLLPWWLPLLAEQGISVACLIVVRQPMEVCRSLAKRDGFTNEKGLLLWIEHYLQAERGSRGLPRSFVLFDDLLSDPVGTFTRVEAELSMHFPVEPSVARACLSEFVSKDLRHHAGPLADEGQLYALAQDIYERFMLAAQGGHAPGEAEMDACANRFENIRAEFPALLVDQIRRINQRCGDINLVLNKVFRSFSWFVGKPIRYIERLVGRDV